LSVVDGRFAHWSGDYVRLPGELLFSTSQRFLRTIVASVPRLASSFDILVAMTGLVQMLVKLFESLERGAATMTSKAPRHLLAISHLFPWFDRSLDAGFDRSLDVRFDRSLGVRFNRSLEGGFDRSTSDVVVGDVVDSGVAGLRLGFRLGFLEERSLEHCELHFLKDLASIRQHDPRIFTSVSLLAMFLRRRRRLRGGAGRLCLDLFCPILRRGAVLLLLETTKRLTRTMRILHSNLSLSLHVVGKVDAFLNIAALHLVLPLVSLLPLLLLDRTRNNLVDLIKNRKGICKIVKFHRFEK